jgi:hypothetical protein
MVFTPPKDVEGVLEGSLIETLLRVLDEAGLETTEKEDVGVSAELEEGIDCLVLLL